MAEIVNERLDIFKGLNNKLNPGSSEYREGMAYRAKDARIDGSGVWTARPKLTSSTVEPTHITSWRSGAQGPHYKCLAVENALYIIDGLNSTDVMDVGPNEILYATTGDDSIQRKTAESDAFAAVAAPTAPTVDPVPAQAAGTSRAENGTYYYIFTSYDTTYEVESLPSGSKAHEVELTDNSSYYITMTATVVSGCETRIYRSRRTSAEDNVYNPTNIFYYVGKLTEGGAYIDQAHDNEIVNLEYDGRGSAPPTGVDYLVKFQNKMLYFVQNTLWWSSPDRPQEVAREYSLTIGTSANPIKCKPLLTTGVYGEARFEISELAGQTVTAAIARTDKLWVWTASETGYVTPTNRLEGFRYHTFRKGIGAVNDKSVVETPYGIFGADRQGMWLLDNYGDLRRITDNTIDLRAGTDTTLTQSYITEGFLLWVPIINEVWWSMQHSATPTYLQIVYQADRRIFVGPYSHAITGGCNFVNSNGTYAYVTGDYIVDVDTADAVAHYLDFWLGQSAPVTIKDGVRAEIVHSATPGASVSVSAYQNEIASTSGLTAHTQTYSDATGVVTPQGQGRLFKLAITLPTALAPISTINYRYDAAGCAITGYGKARVI